MTAEQIAILSGIIGILDKLGTWPMGLLIFFSILGPWILCFLLSRSSEKRQEALNQEQEKRYQAVQKMYENNVELVKTCNRLAEEHQELVIMNTQALTKLIEKIDQNQSCPYQRVEKKKIEVVV